MHIEPRFATETYPALKNVSEQKKLNLFFSGISAMGLMTLATMQYETNENIHFVANPMSITGIVLALGGAAGLVATTVAYYFKGKREEKEGPY